MVNINKNRYDIIVRNLAGKIITFHVDDYTIDSGFVVFKDDNNVRQRFAVSNCEIKEPMGDPK